MTNIIRVLSPEVITKANAFGDEVGCCRNALDTVHRQIGDAALAGVVQNSPRWDQLCKDLAAKVDDHITATTAERDWCRAKCFNV